MQWRVVTWIRDTLAEESVRSIWGLNGETFFCYSMTGEASGKEGAYMVGDTTVVNTRQNGSLGGNCISNS